MTKRTKLIFTISILFLAALLLACQWSTLGMTNAEVLQFVQGTPMP